MYTHSVCDPLSPDNASPHTNIGYHTTTSHDKVYVNVPILTYGFVFINNTNWVLIILRAFMQATFISSILLHLPSFHYHTST